MLENIIEFIVISLLIGMGALFWSIYKAPQYLRKMLADENRLRKLLVGENGELLINKFASDKPLPGDYFTVRIENILNSCRTDYAKIRNISLVVALLLIGGSFFLGTKYFAFNIFAFAFLYTIGVVEPVQKRLSADIVSIATGIAKWHGLNPVECGEYCASRPELSCLHQIITAKQD